MRFYPVTYTILTAILALGVLTQLAAGADADKAAVNEGTYAAGMDYGPFLQYSVSRDPGPKSKKNPARVGIAEKGLTIDVGNGATVCFDEDTCRMAAGWTGGFLDLSRTHMTNLKGWWDATPQGTVVFSSESGPGWAKGESFADPRPKHFGPLPKDWVHYKGLYRNGRQVIVSYSVGNVDVLESPFTAMVGNRLAFCRNFQVGPSSTPLRILICDGRDALPVGRSLVNINTSSRALEVTVNQMPDGASLEVVDHSRAMVKLPPLRESASFIVVVREQDPPGPSSNAIAFADIPDLHAKCKGGPPLWDKTIVTEGRLAPFGKQPYVVDTLPLPDDNPWHSWMRPTGLDFFPDGRCAVCTLNGDVWIVSHIDAGLQHVTWKRFAAGLYEPLGLKIVDGQIYVLGRDQITRLSDLNGDGEADFYENFNNDVPTWPAYNTFHFDLQTDSQGNFWYLTSGLGVTTDIPMQSAAIKVSKYGDKAEVVATGLRAANGAGMGPNDMFVCSDNQGNWTPVCRINLVKPGGFYGFNYVAPLATKEDIAHEKKAYDVPLCWIPYEYDNSTGGQVFVSGGKWGPLEGKMLSTSYGKCKLFEVVWEESEGIIQGASIPLPMSFDSGIMRARFSPADGQLYVCGIKGWQTSAARDGCLQRVRYTGAQVCLPTDLHVRHDELAITFGCPLDPKTANDEQSFGIEQYNYKWSSKYGSGKYKVSEPGKVGTDDLPVKSAHLLPDGKTVVLSVPGLKPVMQMAIHISLEAANGAPIECEIDPTINHVPGSSDPPVLSAP